jgi:hypothetical protein
MIRTFNETNMLRRNRRLIFQQNARHYLQQARFNQTESFDLIHRSIRDLQTLIDCQLPLDKALQDENKFYRGSNSRFQHRDVPEDNVEAFNNLSQFNIKKMKVEIG